MLVVKVVLRVHVGWKGSKYPEQSWSWRSDTPHKYSNLEGHWWLLVRWIPSFVKLDFVALLCNCTHLSPLIKPSHDDQVLGTQTGHGFHDGAASSEAFGRLMFRVAEPCRWTLWRKLVYKSSKCSSLTSREYFFYCWASYSLLCNLDSCWGWKTLSSDIVKMR